MRPPNFWLTERRYTKDSLIRKMTRVCRLIHNLAGGSILDCQHFQENVNEIRNTVNDVRKPVNLFSKTTVNNIRK